MGRVLEEISGVGIMGAVIVRRQRKSPVKGEQTVLVTSGLVSKGRAWALVGSRRSTSGDKQEWMIMAFGCKKGTCYGSKITVGLLLVCLRTLQE